MKKNKMTRVCRVIPCNCRRQFHLTIGLPVNCSYYLHHTEYNHLTAVAAAAVVTYYRSPKKTLYHVHRKGNVFVGFCALVFVCVQNMSKSFKQILKKYFGGVLRSPGGDATTPSPSLPPIFQPRNAFSIS